MTHNLHYSYMSSKKNKGPMASVMKVRKQPNQHQFFVLSNLCIASGGAETVVCWVYCHWKCSMASMLRTVIIIIPDQAREPSSAF